jgi:hypothetical protein
MVFLNINTAPPQPAGKCCTDDKCESGLRNAYYPGKRLTADSFRIEQRYQLERRHLLNRAVFGWGVVYGYGVGAVSTSNCHQAGSGRLCVGAGLALDRCGRELLQVGKVPLDLGDVLFVDEKGARVELGQDGKPNREACWLLSVHYAEEHHGPVTVSDACSCERREHDHVCETVRYSLRAIPCGERCRDWPCELRCGCDPGDCCKEPPVFIPAHEDAAGPVQAERVAATLVDLEPSVPPRQPAAPPFIADVVEPLSPIGADVQAPGRGGCRCLCDHLIGLEIGGECGLCEVDEPCGSVWVDLRNGVPLAAVKLAVDAAGRLTFGSEIEPCGPRRLVKRNDLLFDLIRGCDLTRISEIGWAGWHRRDTPLVPFEEFSYAIGPKGEHQRDYVANAFWVRFSRAVREDTLRPDCFAMTVIAFEPEGGWWQPLRVPIVRLQMIPAEKGDPAGHVRGAKLVFNGAWVEDGLRGRHSHFLAGATRVEIEVRGDFILDCNGQAVDVNAHGRDPVPGGNGAPGGVFLSTFRVEKAKEDPAEPTSQVNDSPQGVAL